jgi:hypothetical protein
VRLKCFVVDQTAPVVCSWWGMSRVTLFLWSCYFAKWQVGVVGGAVDDVSKVVEGGVNSASEDGTVTGERVEAHDEQTGGSEAVGEVAVEPQAAAQASQSTGSVAEKPPASEEGSVRDCSALAQSHSVGSGVSELVASSSLPELQALVGHPHNKYLSRSRLPLPSIVVTRSCFYPRAIERHTFNWFR